MKKTLKELREMTMKDIIAFAEQWGVAVNKKGSKTSAIGKIQSIAPEAIVSEKEIIEAEVADAEPVEVVKAEEVEASVETVEPAVDKVEPEKVEEVKKKGGRKRTKKTFEELVADIPACANIKFVRANKGAVHVKRGNKRIFGYSGPVIVVNDIRLLEGIEYEQKNYGCRVEPTEENMKAIFANLNNN